MTVAKASPQSRLHYRLGKGGRRKRVSSCCRVWEDILKLNLSESLRNSSLALEPKPDLSKYEKEAMLTICTGGNRVNVSVHASEAFVSRQIACHIL